MVQLFIPSIKHIGKQSYSSPDLYIANPEQTTIGAFVSIGNGVRIGHGAHPLGYLSSSPYLYLDKLGYKTQDTPSYNDLEDKIPSIHIGSDVWIGDGVWIKNGVHIGAGAVIGAHAVVTKNVAPYAIMVGNPARLLRYRFPEDIIRELLASEWWNLPDAVIRTLPFDNVQACLAKLKEIRKENPVK